jgi:hypothetical protein
VSVNRDFCLCGEYVGWDVPAPGPDAPAAGPVEYRPPAPSEVTSREVTVLALRDPARDVAAGADVRVSVVPGEEVTVLATVRNQSQIVDTFDVRIDGLPEGWWTITPGAVYLNPYGTSGAYEQEVSVRLHPPRTPDAVAGAWPVTVLVRSRSLGVDVAWVRATLQILPFQSTVMTVGPERRTGRRHASFDVAVANHGNSPLEIEIAAQDTEARCPVSIAPARTVVPVAAAAAGIVLVDVPKPHLVGRPTDHAIEITHRAIGLESEPIPQRVTFRQKPWLPWWVPPVVALVVACVAAFILLRPQREVPKLEGTTIAEAQVMLQKAHLGLGQVRYTSTPKSVPLHTVLTQQPAPGDDAEKGMHVNLTLAAPPQTSLVPPVNGKKLADAADSLKAAHLTYSPQPSSAGNDWVVIRQDPTPGTLLQYGKAVTLAVEQRAKPKPKATATATPTPTPKPKATPKPAATGSGSGAAKAAAGGGASAAGGAATAGIASAATPKPKLPQTLIFAGATSGLIQRWGAADAKPARLTSPTLEFETPVKLDDGFAAIQVTRAGRVVTRISSDGTTVTPIAQGNYFRPAYAPGRGLLALVAADGRGGPGDAGELCTLDPQAIGAPTCASGARVGRPAWSPNGRRLLALVAGPDGAYDELVTYAATGGDPEGWRPAAHGYHAAAIRSAAWLGTNRIAILVAAGADAPAHLRLLARGAHGSFKTGRDFPSLTGCELAATGHYLALRRGNCANGDGAMVLLDANLTQPRLRGLTSGSNPAWAG